MCIRDRYYPDLLARMAQFELTLLDWAEAHKGSKKYVAFADKCWPCLLYTSFFFRLKLLRKLSSLILT